MSTALRDRAAMLPAFYFLNTASAENGWTCLNRSTGSNHVAVLRDSAISAGLGQYGAVQSAASSFGVEVSAVNLRDASEIERDIAAFATTSGGGLIVSGSPPALIHRRLIITLAARHKLPAIYYERDLCHRRRPDLLWA